MSIFTALILVSVGLILQSVCLVLYIRWTTLKLQELTKMATEAHNSAHQTFSRMDSLHRNVLSDAKEIMDGKDVDIPTDTRLCPECGQEKGKEDFPTTDYMCLACRMIQQLFA